MIFYCSNCWTHVKEDEKVCHECGNDLEPFDNLSCFEKLVNALNHSERTTRIRAAYILGTLGDRRAINSIAKVLDKLRGTEDVFFAETIAIALGRMGAEETFPILVRLMEYSSFLVRRAALRSLGNFRSEEAIRAIQKALKDQSPSVQELAQEILRDLWKEE